MSAPKVRTDHLQLKEAATRFGGQAQAAQESLRSLKGQMEVLEGGDWQGLGATAFYQEMSGQVLPAVQRLAAALVSAQQATLNINQLMEQAEADAAAVLRGDGAASQTALGALSALGVAAGPPTGSQTGGSAGGGGAGGAAAPTFRAATSPLADAVGRMVAQDQAAVERKLSNFSQGVRDIVKKSPTLSMQIAQLEKEGYTIRSGAVGTPNFTDRDGKLISIAQTDPPATDGDIAAMIAHEVGHGVSDQVLVQKAPGMTGEEYVNANLPRMMLDEGRAQFNAAQVRREVRDSGGPDIGIPGEQDAAFQQAFDDFTAGNLTHDQTIQRMADLMANEHSSGNPNLKYRDYYRELLQMHWDDVLDDPPPPPRK